MYNVHHIFEARNLDAFCNETIWVTEIIHWLWVDVPQMYLTSNKACRIVSVLAILTYTRMISKWNS